MNKTPTTFCSQNCRSRASGALFAALGKVNQEESNTEHNGWLDQQDSVSFCSQNCRRSGWLSTSYRAVFAYPVPEEAPPATSSWTSKEM